MKNAFCILAHNEPEILRNLVSALDDVNSDIYIHLDKKSNCFDEEKICNMRKNGRVVFIPRQGIGWGGEYDSC